MPKWPEADAFSQRHIYSFIAEWLYWPTWWPANCILAQAQELVNTLNTTGEKIGGHDKIMVAL